MRDFIEYWLTKTGLRPGGFPQPITKLHRQYKKLAQTYGFEEVATYQTFKEELASLGYTIKRWKGCQCLYSKRITLAPTQYYAWLERAKRKRERQVKRYRKKVRAARPKKPSWKSRRRSPKKSCPSEP